MFLGQSSVVLISGTWDEAAEDDIARTMNADPWV